MSSESGQVSVCVINLKGGVGKSTITALLARAAFLRKLDVLTVDLDPQANLSQALMGNAYRAFLTDQRPSIVELFNGYLPPSSTKGSVTPISGNSAVETINEFQGRSLQLIPSRFDFSDNLIASVRPDPKVLARHLSGHFPQKDIIFIDCAPTESVLTHAAYNASSKVLVPVKPEFFATIGFPLLNQSLQGFKSSNRGHKLDVLGVVINNAFYDGGNDGGPEKAASLRDIQLEAQKNDWKIFGHEIPFSRGFPKLMRGDYSYQGNATMFQNFAGEFFRELGI